MPGELRFDRLGQHRNAVFEALAGHQRYVWHLKIAPVCGYLATEKMLCELDKWGDPADDEAWVKKAGRKVWMLAQGTPKGFVKQYKNLTQVSIVGSGHEVPWYKPQVSCDMLTNWLSPHRDFPGYVPEPKRPVKVHGEKAREAVTVGV